MVREGWWHLQSPARLRVPLLDANEVATIRAVLVGSYARCRPGRTHEKSLYLSSGSIAFVLCSFGIV